MAFLVELESLTALLLPMEEPSPASPRFKICGFHKGLLAGGDSSLVAAGTSAVELFLTSSCVLGGLFAGTRDGGGSSFAGGPLTGTSVVSRIALERTMSAAVAALEGSEVGEAFAGGAFAVPDASNPGGGALKSAFSLAIGTSGGTKPGGGGFASGGPALMGADRGGGLFAFVRLGASPAGGGFTAGGLLLSLEVSKTGAEAGGGGSPGGGELREGR